MKTDLSLSNPFSSYSSDFAANFSFGSEFDSWVCDTMMPALVGNHALDHPQSLADIGSGPCYWASLFLSRASSFSITAVDPSEDLINVQAGNVLAKHPLAIGRLSRRCETVQDFTRMLDQQQAEPVFDCFYFMQSAHYVGHSEFEATMKVLAKSLKEGGRIVIQARNMTPDWYPWAFPDEWLIKVEEALHATDMFYRAERYESVFNKLSAHFSRVESYEKVTTVSVPCVDYWQRLENRWISTFMSETIIDADLHRRGIDNMKAQFKSDGLDVVSWTEKFAVVTAYV